MLSVSPCPCHGALLYTSSESNFSSPTVPHKPPSHPSSTCGCLSACRSDLSAQQDISTQDPRDVGVAPVSVSWRVTAPRQDRRLPHRVRAADARRRAKMPRRCRRKQCLPPRTPSAPRAGSHQPATHNAHTHSIHKDTKGEEQLLCIKARRNSFQCNVLAEISVAVWWHS